MRIAIVTLFTSEIADYAEISVANKTAYARRQGYDCFVYSDRLDSRRHPAWSKLVAFSNHISGYDWLFWTDADSLIMDPERRLESIISKHPDKDMILTWEVGAAMVNTGQWLVRNSDWSRAALEAIADAACPNSRPDWYEQGALIDWLREDRHRVSHLAILHPRVMNSTPDVALYDNLPLARSRYRFGDFIIHFWPLARQHDAILRMMRDYDALSQRPAPRSPGLRALLNEWRSARSYKRR